MINKNSNLHEVLSHTHPCKCSACTNGCNFGSGAMADEDIPKLADHLDISHEELKEKYLEEIEKFNTKRFRPKLNRKEGKPYGKCIFYKDNECSIHEAKPLECKISMGCKEYGEDLITWFNLNYFVNVDDHESVRQWATSLLSGRKTIEGGSIPELIKSKKKIDQIFGYHDIKTRFKKDWDKILGFKSDNKKQKKIDKK